MADNAQTPAPGTHPDAVVINDDGSVTAHGRKAWVWVHDESTGARYDVPATMLPRQGLRPVEGYPVNNKPHARTAKTALVLGDVPPPGAVSTEPATLSAARATAAAAAAARATAASLAAGPASVSTVPDGPVVAEPSDAGATPAPDLAGAAGELAEGAGAGDAEASTTSPKVRRTAR